MNQGGECVWTLAQAEDRHLKWDTYCRKSFPYLKDIPAGFGWEFCPYCGGHLAIDARMADAPPGEAEGPEPGPP